MELEGAGPIEIGEERARTLGRLAVAGGLLALLAAGALALAWRDGGIGWFFAVVLGLVATGLVGAAIRQVLHERKFGRSVLVLRESPVRLGERVAGEVRTGIPRGEAAPRIRVRLQCVHAWEEERDTGEDRRAEQRREVLWSVERDVTGAYRAGPTGTVAVVVPVALDLPADQPQARAGAADGIAWELNLHAPLPGLDYRATFRLPVVGRG